jgi:hypothetical protein
MMQVASAVTRNIIPYEGIQYPNNKTVLAAVSLIEQELN